MKQYWAQAAAIAALTVIVLLVAAAFVTARPLSSVMSGSTAMSKNGDVYVCIGLVAGTSALAVAIWLRAVRGLLR